MILFVFILFLSVYDFSFNRLGCLNPKVDRNLESMSSSSGLFSDAKFRRQKLRMMMTIAAISCGNMFSFLNQPANTPSGVQNARPMATIKGVVKEKAMFHM